MDPKRRGREGVNRSSIDRKRRRSLARGSLALALAALLTVWSAPAGAQEPGNPNLVYTSASESVRSGFDQAYSFDVPCPAGTVALGGGSAQYGTESTPTSGEANAWRIGGMNIEEGDRPVTYTGYASCATTEAFPAGSLAYPQPVSIRLKPWPVKPESGTAEVSCPSGTVPLAGGFAFENHAIELEVGGSYPTWAAEGNTTGRTWVVGGENGNIAPFNINSWDLTAATTCVSSALAFGVFQMHAAGAEAEMGQEYSTLIASCGTDSVIAGGFAAFNSKGTKPDYTGSLASKTFTESHDGFAVRYSSGHPDHHLFRVYAICADIAPAVGSLNQADFDTACRAAMPGKSGVHAVAGQLATDWRCASEDEASVPIPGNQGAWACAAARGIHAPAAAYLSRGDPFSWVCYGLPDGAQPASKLKGKASFTASSGGARVEASGRTKVRRPVGNLRRAHVTVPAILLEATGSGDLLKRADGRRMNPVLLKPRGRRGHYFVFAGRSKPRLTLRLRLSKNHKAYLFDLRARGGRLAKPRLCDSGPRPTTHLTTRFVIDAGERHPTDVIARSFWSCGGRGLETARPALRLP